MSRWTRHITRCRPNIWPGRCGYAGTAGWCGSSMAAEADRGARQARAGPIQHAPASTSPPEKISGVERGAPGSLSKVRRIGRIQAKVGRSDDRSPRRSKASACCRDCWVWPSKHSPRQRWNDACRHRALVRRLPTADRPQLLSAGRARSKSLPFLDEHPLIRAAAPTTAAGCEPHLQPGEGASSRTPGSLPRTPIPLPLFLFRPFNRRSR